MRISDWSSDVCSSDLIGDIKTRIAPTAGDDADLAWWFRSHRACAACGANMPVFSRIRDPMFGFIKKTKAPAHDDSQPVEPESAASDAKGWSDSLRGSGMARGLLARAEERRVGEE